MTLVSVSGNGGSVVASARKHHCPRMKVSVAGAASGIMGVAAGGGSAIGLGGHRDT